VFQFDRAIISRVTDLPPKNLEAAGGLSAPRAIGALTQSFISETWGAIEGLHYAMTGVPEQELDGWSRNEFVSTRSSSLTLTIFVEKASNFNKSQGFRYAACNRFNIDL